MSLTLLAINCSLKHKAGEESSTDKMIGLLAGEMAKHGVGITETIRIVDHNILSGVSPDEGPGDGWPDIRRRILDQDILIFGTPIWLGQMSSLAQRKRRDAGVECSAHGEPFEDTTVSGGSCKARERKMTTKIEQGASREGVGQ